CRSSPTARRSPSSSGTTRRPEGTWAAWTRSRSSSTRRGSRSRMRSCRRSCRPWRRGLDPGLPGLKNGLRGTLMSTDDPTRKGQDFLQIVAKAKEFTEELLKENERLRFKVASLETAGGKVGSDERVQELQRRVRDLEEKLAEVQARYKKVEEENKEFAGRDIALEEENKNEAN